jgi:hypothetical protein
MPLMVEAELLNVNHKKLTSSIYQLASGVYECSRLHLSSVLPALMMDISNGLIPVAMIAYVVYDETPLRASAAGGNTARETSRRLRRSDRSTQILKIEQCELIFAFVVRRTGAERCTVIHTELVCPLQNSDRNTGEIIRRHLIYFKSLPMWETLKTKFPIVLELTTRDRASGNLRAERSLAEGDPVGMYFGQWCSVHCLHCIVGRMLTCISTTVSGAIALALAQRDSGEEESFRRWLRRRPVCFAVSAGSIPMYEPLGCRTQVKVRAHTWSARTIA